MAEQAKERGNALLAAGDVLGAVMAYTEALELVGGATADGAHVYLSNRSAALLKAGQRNMYRDFLAPIELYRPGELAGFTVNKTGDLDAMSFEQLEERVKLRLDAAKSDKHFGKVYFGDAYEVTLSATT